MVANGLVYYCGAGLCAIDISSGAMEWTALTDTDFWTNMPTVAGNMIYMGSPQTGILYALDATTGEQIWTFQTNATWDQPFSAPIVVNGVVYFGAGDLIYALDAKTGAFLWSYATEDYVSKSSPALANGILYETSTTIYGSLYALNAKTGAYIWSFPTDDAKGSPVVFDGIVYITSYNQNLYALDASTGNLLWTFTTSQPIETTPVIANGILYFLSDESILYALDARTGSTEWKRTLGRPGENPGHLAIANGVLYVPFDSIDAFDASTGTLLYQSPKIGVDAISVTDGVIYAGASLNNNGVLHAFGLPAGKSDSREDIRSEDNQPKGERVHAQPSADRTLIGNGIPVGEHFSN